MQIWETVWEAVVGAVVVCTLCASLRTAVVGLGHPPINRAARFLSRDAWGFALVILLPMYLGEFARREVSPVPWIAFASASARHGVLDAIFTGAMVLLIDLWLLWIPAHSFIINRPGVDRRTAMLSRLLNLVLGLLLMTPDNPLYGLLGAFPRGSGGYEP